MGQWGFYDDEGDSVADFACELQDAILPDDLKDPSQHEIKETCLGGECKEKAREIKEKYPDRDVLQVHHGRTVTFYISTPELDSCQERARQYMVDHVQEVWQTVKDDLKDANYWGSYGYEKTVAGIAVYMARGWSGTPIFGDEEDEKTPERGFHFPRRLPENFPDEWREAAYQASKTMFEDESERSTWSNPQKRKEALHDQMILFEAPRSSRKSSDK
jgi:hypothetical protein